VARIFRFRFLDHHRFTGSELREISGEVEARGLDALVTTEKDAVRIKPDFQPGVPFYFLRVEIHMLAGGENFEAAVRRICFPRQEADADRWKSGLTRPPFPGGANAQ
jgi:tetraacyldisaccharide 4'-kinase